MAVTLSQPGDYPLADLISNFAIGPASALTRMLDLGSDTDRRDRKTAEFALNSAVLR